MSADRDGDSQMVVSSSDSDSELATPTTQVINSGTLSPPNSQHREPVSRNMPTSASGASIANSNGKRPIQTISNGHDDLEETLPNSTNGKTKQEYPTRTHQGSGYAWTKPEDEPGYSWLNKKALDEHQRALEQVVHREYAVRDRYGDPFEAADQERAVLASLQQR